MILRCYSVFDRKALQYFPPFHQSTDGSAIRSFADLANDLNTQVGRHPNDFVLFYIGDYDDQKGAMLPASPLVHVVDAIALVNASKELPFPPDLKTKDMAAWMNGEEK